jgi:membrane associated rhomboid family serine protease
MAFVAVDKDYVPTCQQDLNAPGYARRMNLLSPVCVIVGLYLAFTAGLIFIKSRSKQSLGAMAAPMSHFPLATSLLFVMIALPTTLQLVFPVILSALERDYAQFLSGDWWRAVTPLFVQDGGVPGTIFNLVGLLLVGAVSERLWGGRRMMAIFFGGGIVSEVVAFAWQPIGAGNSVGNFSLAASIAVRCLAPQAGRIPQAIALLALAADTVLLVLKDIHGVAALAGVILALALRSWGQSTEF